MPLEFIEKLIFHPDLEKIYLIGANGEPTQHPHFLEIVKEIKRRSSAQIYINTHGSFKNFKWWEALGKILSPRDQLVFSIDGLQDTNHVYRVNAKWHQIEEAVKASVGRATTTWKFIVFRHNQHQVLEAIQLAKKWGLDYFSLKRSDRWNDAYWPQGENASWMEYLKPEEEFVTRSYQSVEGEYGGKSIFNSVFNLKLANLDVRDFARIWRGPSVESYHPTQM